MAEARRRAGRGVRGGSADPLGYILNANINRRHMTRAQRAMALAMMAPEPSNRKGGRAKTEKILSVYEGDERSAMKQAINKTRVVLRYKPLIRAYRLAIKHGLVDEADARDAADLLRCSMRTANELTKDGARRPQEGAGVDRLPAAGARPDAGADRR